MANCREWLNLIHKERQEMIGELVIALQSDSQCFRQAKKIMFLAKKKKIHHHSRVNVTDYGNE